MAGSTRPGRAFVGTSGFAYPDWAPRFYAPRMRAADLLAAYAARLPAVELNNTFYQQPSEAKVRAWLAATPAGFRFTVKAQRGASWRALRGDAAGVAESVAWLTAPYRLFGERLGCVLFRIGEESPRNDDALARLLAAWPRDLPLAVELQHPSWADDAVHGLLRDHGTALVATDLDASPVLPDLRLTGPFLYLRLRRTDYAPADLDAWADRLAPFLADGRDAFVFLRHDADGASAIRAEAIVTRLSRTDGA